MSRWTNNLARIFTALLLSAAILLPLFPSRVLAETPDEPTAAPTDSTTDVLPDEPFADPLLSLWEDPEADQALLAAYQVTLEQFTLPPTIDLSAPFVIETRWQNTSPLAFDDAWELVYLLRDSESGMGWQALSSLAFDSLGAASSGHADTIMIADELPAGVYTFGVVVRSQNNIYRTLPLQGRVAQFDGSYDLGQIIVGSPVAAQLTSDAQVQAGSFRLYLPLVRQNSNEPALTVSGARGYLTTPQELASILSKSKRGMQPYARNVSELLNHQTISSPTAWTTNSTISGSPQCADGTTRYSSGNLIPRGPLYLIDGSRLTYAKMLAAHLTLGTSRADAYARDARRRILELIDTTNWGGTAYHTDNICILYLSWFMPNFVMAADLLESFPQIWTTNDKRAFQRWLALEVYHKAAWSSRSRTNNWGSSGSYAAAMIADYLHDSGRTLQEYAPTRRSLSPGQAYFEHTREQLSRMSTTITDRDRQDSRCLPRKGIQPGGGIPDELRRASISNPLQMCSATYLPSITGGYLAAYQYQMIQIETLIAHAELALRRGDRSLYDNRAADGSGSLLRAINFILANPARSSASYNWQDHRKSQLYVAFRYYRHSAMQRQFGSEALRGGEIVTYGRLTHSFASSENPGRPPVTPPATR